MFLKENKMKLKLNQKIRTAFVAGMVTFAVLQPTFTQAAPVAQQKTQAPGFYRMMLGNFEVTALYDGYVPIEAKLLKGINAQDAQTLLARMFLADAPAVQTAVNGYLINTGKNLILVDAGTAQCFGPTMGNMLSNLSAAGYDPAQVDTVLLTHMHGDHACGLTKEGKAAFPNATVYVSKNEADFWLNPKEVAKATPELQGYFKMSQDAVAPYVTTKKLKTYKMGDKLLEAVEVVSTPGHTPGHTSYLIRSNKQSILLWGDIVHSHAVQFVRPEVALEFDVDSQQAVVTRKKILKQVAEDKLWVGGAHLPFPGLGHVRAEKEGYSWVPVEYNPVK